MKIDHEAVSYITCPQCGSRDLNSGERSDIGKHACDCGALFWHEREVTVTYDTGILLPPRPMPEEPKMGSYVFFIIDGRVSSEKWFGFEWELRLLDAGLCFESKELADDYLFILENKD